MVPKCSAEMLSSVPKCERAEMRLTEKIHVLNSHQMRVTELVAVEFTVSVSTICTSKSSFKRNTHKTI